MGIQTVMVLSILAMALGVVLFLVWMNQKRHQMRMRAVARFNRERQVQSGHEPKGPKVVERGNKRMIIDPLVDGFDDEATEDFDDGILSTPRALSTANPANSQHASMNLHSRDSNDSPLQTRAQLQTGSGYHSVQSSVSRSQMSPQHGNEMRKSGSENSFSGARVHLSEAPSAISQPEEEEFSLGEKQGHSAGCASVILKNNTALKPEFGAEKGLENGAQTSGQVKINSKPKDPRVMPEYLTLSLMADQSKPFAGHELLHSILSAGLRFGERHIFHRYDATVPTKILFSMASIAKPGVFPLEKMRSFSTPGLIFIFEIDMNPELLDAFELLLETAQRLSDELDGTLLDDRRQPLTTHRIQILRQELRDQMIAHEITEEDLF